ncbi:MAG: carboxynorspermidine decarboxylase [Sedimentisphaerales bacterium]|nr:carboxynorspermidine decarboxylase [Sedimentisphaerales bacterium]
MMAGMGPEIPYDLDGLDTPCYLIDLGRLEGNLKVLADVQSRAGCRILLALKAYAAWGTFDLCRRYLWGAAASSLNEVKLAVEHLGKEVHLCAPAYRQDEFEQFLCLVDHIVFNSFGQWDRFRSQVSKARRSIRCGLRINPGHSEVKTPMYDPCGPCSRLGITADQFRMDLTDGITGLHFHSLCELNADALERTLAAVEARFGAFLRRVEWVNLGGGHYITRPDYDRDLLCKLIMDLQDRYRNIQVVYLEPGEAVALDAGFLVSSVLDIVHNQMAIAILDCSASTHMPDVLEMPYRPQVIGADLPGKRPYTYRLAGPTCLAGDVIGDYSFDRPLRVGDKLVFTDMAHYTMVKNTMFNGINLPDIVFYEPGARSYRLQRRFGYLDYRDRLS